MYEVANIHGSWYVVMAGTLAIVSGPWLTYDLAAIYAGFRDSENG